MSELFEQVEGADEEPTEANTAPVKRNEKPKDGAVAPQRQPRQSVEPTRNLTFEAILASMRANKAAEIAKVAEEETVSVALPKLDAKGKKMKDGLGYVLIEQRTVLKRDKVSIDWDARIEKFARTHNV